MAKNSLQQKKERRKVRVRAKLFGTAKKPRLSVFRSNNYFYVQLIDDEAGKTLAASSDRNLKAAKGKSKGERVKMLAIDAVEKAKAKKINTVIFDRGALPYAGNLKLLAETMREGGIIF
ncbi:MAG TPA: 50S ribosomal protein L18 [Candidatus Paceibacterota bacterium]